MEHKTLILIIAGLIGLLIVVVMMMKDRFTVKKTHKEKKRPTGKNQRYSIVRIG